MGRAQKVGKVAMGDMMKKLNKKYGMEVAHNLNEANPTEVKEWIPTGSRWLDSIICKGRVAGIPVGKFTEIAGLSATGKSYLAIEIAANAQKMGHYVVYFDSESAIDPSFIRGAGVDTDPDKFMYIQAVTVEQVFEMTEEFIGSGEKVLIIWDSIANTPTESDKEGSFNPNSSIGKKARTLSLAFQKLTVPLANSQCTFLALNQLKTNIASTPAQRMEVMMEPYVTPGGKSTVYATSLRIWLTGRKAKAAYIKDENGFTIGSEIKARLKKSRFGTERRECTFKIMWGGDEIRILDEESWFEAVKSSEHILQSGAWYTLVYEDGEQEKFQATKWGEKIENPKFKARILELMDIEVIGKYKNREGSAEAFENIDINTNIVEED
jgi:recombination protein RecA